jgi:hypothetical protein
MGDELSEFDSRQGVAGIQDTVARYLDAAEVVGPGRTCLDIARNGARFNPRTAILARTIGHDTMIDPSSSGTVRRLKATGAFDRDVPEER